MTTPTTGYNMALNNLRNALAGCSAFQTFAGAEDATEALARIHTNALPKPAAGGVYTLAEMQAYRPCAIIWTAPDQGGYRYVKEGTRSFCDSGMIVVCLHWSIPVSIEDDPQEIEIQFGEHVGGIMDDLADQAESGFRVQAMEPEGPYQNPEDSVPTEGNYLMGIIHLKWGEQQ